MDAQRWARTNQCSGPASTTRRRSGSTRPRRSTGRRHRPGPSTPEPPFYRWFPDGELNICANALDRHVDAGRGDQRGADLRQPGHRHQAHLHLRASCATRSPRFAGVLAGLGVGKGDRVVIYMPMVPEAVDRDAGLRPARRRALGGVRRLRAARAGRPDRRRHPEGDRVGVLRHRGQAGHRVQAAAGQGDRAGRAQARQACVILQRPQATAAMGPDDVDWAEAMASADPAEPVTGQGDRPALHPLHLGHHREAQGRASATPAATRSRWPGRWPTSTTSARARRCSPPPTSAGSSGTPTSCTRRCWPARPRSVRGQARRHPGRRRSSGGSSPSTG